MSNEKTIEEIYPVTVDKDTIGYNFHIQYVTALREAYTKGRESLQSERDRLRGAGNELASGLYQLIQFCIDIGYLDDEDKTDGQISVDLALSNWQALTRKEGKDGE